VLPLAGKGESGCPEQARRPIIDPAHPFPPGNLVTRPLIQFKDPRHFIRPIPEDGISLFFLADVIRLDFFPIRIYFPDREQAMSVLMA
jgi:hypothetical protein